jgi:hypothetical protein
MIESLMDMETFYLLAIEGLTEVRADIGLV